MAVWKKMTALTLSGLLIFSMCACKGKESEGEDIDIQVVPEEEQESVPEEVEEEVPAVLSDLDATISWWTYPVFVQDEEQEDGVYEQHLIEEFNKKYPNIKVELNLLDYAEGPDQVQGLIEAEGGELPDVLLDGPGRISTYAKEGVLADLGSMFTEEVESDMVSDGILSACRSGDTYVMYPLSASNYVMAFNRYMVEGSGAMELMNQEGARLWTTEAFEQVLERLNTSGFNSGSFYCSGIAGDYATRSFVTNLYDGSLMNEDKSAYTMDSEANQTALTKIQEWMENGWIQNGSGSSGADAVTSFVNGESSYCLLWSLPQAISNAQTLAENGVEAVVMPYPSADGTPSLEYILNGFCIFHQEDEKREEASRYFVDFLCNDETVAVENVIRSGAFPVRTSMGDIYEGNEQAQLYEALLPYSGTYYNKVEGFEEMRVYWYQMAAEILNKEYSVEESTKSFVEYANKTLIKKEPTVE
ncbi:MAG: carbohydrate ABC transporter substrate-binding protein [Lachnospiraceae bacterium]|nr:carbohydrate ABC transporter substrate-binding protein [Lachnospiraceae bacterium]